MPVTKSAKKILKQARKRRVFNLRVEGKYKALVKSFRAKPTLENFKIAVSSLDSAVSKKVIHKNKAARLKSNLSKLLPRATRPARKTTPKAKLLPQKKTPRKT